MILRPYQNDVIEGLRDGFRSGNRRQILSASTGSGKSVIMLAMIKAAADKGTRSIFIVERRKLAEQFSDHLVKNGIAHGVLMAGHHLFRPQELVQVASAQTLERMESWPAFDLMFVDEIHANMRKGSVLKIMDSRPDLKVVGATATPFHKGLRKYFTNVISAPPMAELVGMGNLLPFRAFVAKDTDTSGLKTNSKGEWEQAGLEERGIRIVGDVVTDYLRISQDVYGRKSKSICFSSGIAHGTKLAQDFCAAGINAVQLASGVDDSFRADVFLEFAKPQSSIDMIISAEMLTRGFDQPDIEHVILAKPIKKSFSNFVQMIGRGARPHDGQTFCIVQDHGSNFLRFLPDWLDFYENGVSELSSDIEDKVKKEPTEREKEAAKCPKCSAFWPGHSDTCLHCGYVRERRNMVSELPGECKELTLVKSGLFMVGKATIGDKLRVWQESVTYCKNTGKEETAKGRASHLYKSITGVFPRGLPDFDSIQETTVSQAIINKARSNMIAFHKGRKSA